MKTNNVKSALEQLASFANTSSIDPEKIVAGDVAAVESFFNVFIQQVVFPTADLLTKVQAKVATVSSLEVRSARNRSTLTPSLTLYHSEFESGSVFATLANLSNLDNASAGERLAQAQAALNVASYVDLREVASWSAAELSIVLSKILATNPAQVRQCTKQTIPAMCAALTLPFLVRMDPRRRPNLKRRRLKPKPTLLLLPRLLMLWPNQSPLPRFVNRPTKSNPD